MNEIQDTLCKMCDGKENFLDEETKNGSKFFIKEIESNTIKKM